MATGVSLWKPGDNHLSQSEMRLLDGKYICQKIFFHKFSLRSLTGSVHNDEVIVNDNG